MIELGISTFGETTLIEGESAPISHAKRLSNMLEEVKLADEVGLDIYAIGEHHREDFAVSAPEIVLAAAATITKRIKLSSAVSVLSSLDPIRLYQQYATIDALSQGRVEVMVGRGSFTESFPLFGYRLEDYDELFDEKLAMLLEIKANEKLTWQGKFTQKVENKGVYPRAQNLPIWVATGGNPQSTMNIARLGLPITYAILGGRIDRFQELIQCYKEIGKKEGYSEEALKISAHFWGYIADSNEQAIREYYYPTKLLVDTIAKDRPSWSPLTWHQYLHSVSEQGAMLVGDAKTVANKIIRMVEDLQLNRILIHLPVGSMKHEQVLKAIELLGKEVAPMVRDYFAHKDK